MGPGAQTPTAAAGTAATAAQSALKVTAEGGPTAADHMLLLLDGTTWTSPSAAALAAEVAGAMLEQFGGRCTDEFMRLLTEDSGEALREMQREGPVSSVAFLPGDGALLAVGGFVGKVAVAIIDVASGEVQREVQNQLNDELASARVTGAKLSFHLTSIYDHSVFEAFSKAVQQLIPQLPTLERLLDVLVSSCRIDKAFLFDVVSKIYVLV